VSTAWGADKETIKVGLNLAVAGVFAPLGDGQKKGFDLAIAEINAKGGVLGKKIDVIFYENEGDQAKGEQLANRMIHRDKVVAHFGPNITPVYQVVAPLLEQNKIFNLGFCAQTYLWEGTSYIWVSVPAQITNAEAMVRWAKDKLKVKTVGILYANAPYGVDGNKFLQQWIKKLDLKLLMSDRWGETDFEFTPQVTKVIKANPEAMFIWGSAANADALVVKQLRAAGYKGSMIGDIALTMPHFFEIAGGAMEGLYSFSWMHYDNPSPMQKKFLDAYKTKYNEFAPPLAVCSYDAPYIFKAAAERANSTDPQKVAKAIVGLKYSGVSGAYSYSANNHNGLSVKDYKPMQVKGLKWTSLW